jgi:hypothetical protein
LFQKSWAVRFEELKGRLITFWGGAFLQRKPFEFLAGSKESLNQSGGAEKVATAGKKQRMEKKIW